MRNKIIEMKIARHMQTESKKNRERLLKVLFIGPEGH